MRGQLKIPANQRRVIHALQSGGPAIPDSVLARIQTVEPSPAPRQRRLRPALAGAVAVSLALVIAVLLLTLGGARDSTVVAAVGQSRLPSQQVAQRSFAGIDYADWGPRFRWFKVGGRTDVVDGRRTSTVFYRHTHHRIGYTVIAGRPVAPPGNAEVLRANGLELHRFKLGKDDVVTWVRNGRTCVLAGDVHDPLTLVKLALNS
jgi:hypothetical protein